MSKSDEPIKKSDVVRWAKHIGWAYVVGFLILGVCGCSILGLFALYLLSIPNPHAF